MISQIIIDFLKLLSKFDLFLFFYKMHYSPYFLLPIIIATGTKATATEGCQTWMSLTLSDTECPA